MCHVVPVHHPPCLWLALHGMTRQDIGHIIYQNDENFLIYNYLQSPVPTYIIPIDLTSVLLGASELGFLSLLLGRDKIEIKLVLERLSLIFVS